MARHDRRRILAVPLLVAALATSCGSSAGRDADGGPDPDPSTTIAPAPEVRELAEVGACGDAFVWAATAADDVAVTVVVAQRDRSSGEPTTIRFELPDPAVTVQVLRGRDLSRNFCTDLPDLASVPASTEPVAVGAGKLVLDPQATDGGSSCGDAEVELSLTGLRLDDGTAFAPVAATATGLGCYAG